VLVPKSAESSKLHEFMNLSNLYITIVGFESMVVYKMVVSDTTNPILYYTVVT
jgi:hypothetical protein